MLRRKYRPGLAETCHRRRRRTGLGTFGNGRGKTEAADHCASAEVAWRKSTMHKGGNRFIVFRLDTAVR